MTSSVLVSIRVKGPPAKAFDLFVNDIGLWWASDPLFEITPRGDGRLSFEPGPEGRLVTTLPGGKVFEIGRILDWSPPERLAFSWRQAAFPPDLRTRVDVVFKAVGEETRVSVTHFGWTSVPRENAARHGFPDDVTQIRAAEWWRLSLTRLSARHSEFGMNANASRAGGV